MPMTSGAHGPSFEGRGWKRRSRLNSAGVPIPASHSPSRHDHDPGPDLERALVLVEQLAERRDRGAERGEDEREPEDERRRCQ